MFNNDLFLLLLTCKWFSPRYVCTSITYIPTKCVYDKLLYYANIYYSSYACLGLVFGQIGVKNKSKKWFHLDQPINKGHINF